MVIHMNRSVVFACIGGDQRFLCLAGLLCADGHKVLAAALDKVQELPEGIIPCSSALACETADCVILPLPATDDANRLNAPLSVESIPISSILQHLCSRQMVVAGKVTPFMREAALERNIRIADYFDREELEIANAVPTAEGAIQIAMEESAITLHKSRCLVIGYGRVGKLLAYKLKSIGADVCASARKLADLAWIDAYGCTGLHTNALAGRLSNFDFVFNTVPHLILTRELLSELKKDCLVIDLASKPGGVDFEAAKELAVNVIWALSLPGKVAPLTSGAIIKNTVYNIMLENDTVN